MNNFKCRANNGGYCDFWLRECVGQNNCEQGKCPYCINSGISPKIESICTECEQFDWKKKNYIEK